jgi:hypothetical protein
MLVSAFQRLVLYETAYGFSRLRAYTHVFMIWLALLLITVVVLEVTRRERLAGLAMLLASLGFVISLSLLNVDAFIVNRNVQREVRGDSDAALSQGTRVELDTYYFLDLSDDAVPPLAEAFKNKALPQAVHEKVGTALFCKRFEREQDERTIPWQAFHLARFRAESIFADLKKDLDAYTMTDTAWPLTVKTPSGAEFSCHQEYFD